MSAIAAGCAAIIDSAACSENAIPANDDSYSGQVDLPFDVDFYGETYDHLWAHNGNVTFDGPLSTFTPFGLIAASTPIIANRILFGTSMARPVLKAATRSV